MYLIGFWLYMLIAQWLLSLGIFCNSDPNRHTSKEKIRAESIQAPGKF